ncbi:MAG: hypothetical protein HN623_01800, partial [Bdellovibrionales bacterium]|nr:hypothetical protein [Bdellovibrionales bacterium]
MRYLKLKGLVSCALMLTAWMAGANVDMKGQLKIVGQQRVKSQMMVGESRQALAGRINFELTASPAQLKRGLVKISHFGLVNFSFPQRLITGKRGRGKARAVQGFSAKGGQFLRYDARKNTLSGVIKGGIDFPQLGEFARRDIRGHKQDFEVTPIQFGSVKLVLKLNRPLKNRGAKKILMQKAKVKLTLNASDKSDGTTLKLRPFRLTYRPIDFILKYSFWRQLTFGRKLCLQPVRIKSSVSDPNPTGSGLAFGMPGAFTHWGKANLTFAVRAWKDVIGSQYKTLTATEREELLPMIDDDDCIEVYFVENFSPEDLYGGGVARSGGQASSTITSSDANAFYGIDLTHLAHEIGHVVGLSHPGSGSSGPNMYDGSGGTLMCPSGFQNDNP